MNEKMMIVGDIHIKPSNLGTAQIFFDFLDKKLDEHRPKYLIFLGDVYDTKAIIRSEAQNFLFRWCEKTEKNRDMSILILTGNHDFVDADCSDTALLPLSALSRVTIVDRHKSLGDVGLVAFYRDNNKFLDAIRQNPTWKMVFCHQDFNGFKYNSGIDITEGVALEALDHQTIFIVGHIHTQQKNKNVFFLGTPYSMSFGEANEQKQIALLDEGKLKLIDVVGVPQHYLIEMKIDKDGHVFFDKNLKKDKITSKDFVRFLCKTTKDNLAKLQSEVGKPLKEWLASELWFPDFQIHFDIEHSANVIQIDETWSYDKMASAYIDGVETHLDKERLQNLAQKLLAEAA